MQVIFKKYDLRGIVGKEFNISDVYDITKAIITYFKRNYPQLKNIAVGMDGRSSSLDIKNEVCRAIINTGFNAHFIGLCTTPALYFASHTLNVDAGIMITASHNPKEYNGFKLVLNCESVWAEQIENIYDIYLTKNFIQNAIQAGFYYEHNLIDQYIENLVDSFSHLIGDNINFVIDCGNGSAGIVIPKLINKLKWKNVTILYPEIDGSYPNHEPNPVEIKNMLAVQKFLTNNQQTSFGVGLDGDCDRLGVMTSTGQLLPGDLLLGIFALHLDKKYQPSVIMDSKCSDTIVQALTQKNISCYISPTGFAYIKYFLKKHNATIGGELSGHFCFKDRHLGFDDGIYAMLRLCEILINKKQTLQNLVNIFPKTFCSPEFRFACTDIQKNIILQDIITHYNQQSNTTINNLDGIRVKNNLGWFLVRPANTEPVISICIEGYSAHNLQLLKLDLFEILSKHIERKILTTKMEF